MGAGVRDLVKKVTSVPVKIVRGNLNLEQISVEGRGLVDDDRFSLNGARSIDVQFREVELRQISCSRFVHHRQDFVVTQMAAIVNVTDSYHELRREGEFPR